VTIRFDKLPEENLNQVTGQIVDSTKLLHAVAFKVLKVELEVRGLVARISYIYCHINLKQRVHQFSDSVALVVEVRTKQEQIIEVEHAIPVDVQQVEEYFFGFSHPLPLLLGATCLAVSHPKDVQFLKELFKADWLGEHGSA